MIVCAGRRMATIMKKNFIGKSAIKATTGYFPRVFKIITGVIRLYSEKLRSKDNHAVRAMIGRMQNKIRKQEELLKEMYQEIEGLKSLLSGDSEDGTHSAEGQPVYHEDNLEKVYEIIAGLEKYTTEEVLFYAAQVLAELMDTKDVAIYNIANKDYARLFSATSTEARKLGNSIKYTDMDEMYQHLKSEHVYLNQTMNPEFPLMASAVYNENEIRLILMFWGFSADRITLAEANRLTAIGALIQNAMLRASRYLDTFKSQRYLEGTNVLNEKAFTTLVKAFLEAKADGLTECALVEVMLGYQSYDEVSTLLACNIRLTDYMGLIEGGKLCILLCNTDSKNAEVVQERLRKLGYDSLQMDAEAMISELG